MTPHLVIEKIHLSLEHQPSVLPALLVMAKSTGTTPGPEVSASGLALNLSFLGVGLVGVLKV